MGTGGFVSVSAVRYIIVQQRALMNPNAAAFLVSSYVRVANSLTEDWSLESRRNGWTAIDTSVEWIER